MNAGANQQIYIVISQTGTLLSRILKIVTHKEYNHVSVSLEPNLDKMYSFGRKNPYNPFRGGFVQESPHAGTFKRFSETKVVVLAVQTSKLNYHSMQMFLENMYRNKHIYCYNYIGLMLAAFRICYTHKNHYYCSEFVRDLLLKFKVVDDQEFSPITHLMQFLHLNDAKVVYKGKLKNFYLNPVIDTDYQLVAE